MDFSGQSALITAGASGIGEQIARSFVAAGAAVHVVDVDEAALERITTDVKGIRSSLGDASSREFAAEVVTGHVTDFGGVDVMVNCAGIAGPTALVEDVDPAEWRRCLDVNLDATFHFSALVAPTMKQADAARE